MKNKWYWVYKHVLIGPFLRLYNRPWSEGMDNIPAEGAAIVASNHQSVMDSFYFPLMCPRQLTFIAKAEYFTTPGLAGRFKKWFFSSVGQVPIERGTDSAADGMMVVARRILEAGDLFGIYPEGTRSPDGRIYRGRTGMARVAMETGADVIPVGMIDSRKANPIGTIFPRPCRVGVKVGKPVNPHEWAHKRGLDPKDHATVREFTDFIMAQLAEMTGQPYVDVYASDVKKSLAAGHGYPEGADPHTA